MDPKPFDTPVTVSVPPGGQTEVSSTQEAYELLSGQWPEQARGDAYDDAAAACLKVLDGHRSTIDAREALLRAAREAGILVSG